MLQVNVNANVRKNFGKCEMRRMRVDGKSPAVIYGKGMESIALELDTQDFVKQVLEVNRRNAIYTVNVDGDKSYTSLVKELQADPVKDTLVHADFQAINLEEARLFSVPLVIEGVSAGVDKGGSMNVVMTSVELKGCPLDIPDEILVDVTSLEIGDSKALSSLEIPSNVEMITDGNLNCVSIVSSSVSEEEDTEE